MPQQQRQSYLEARLGGDRTLHGLIPAALSGAAQERPRQVGPARHPLGEAAVQQGEAGRAQRAEADRTCEQLLVLSVPRRHDVTAAQDLGGDPVADLEARRDHPVQDQQTEPRGGALEPLRQPNVSGLGLEPRLSRLRDRRRAVYALEAD